MVVCLKKKNFIFSHFWRIEVQNQGVNRAMFSLKALEKNPSMLLLAFSGCWPFVVFPGFLTCVSSMSSNLPLLLGTLDIRFRTNPNPVLLLFSQSVLSNSLWPHELQHTGLSCPSPSSGPCSTSCSLNMNANQPSHLLSPSPAFSLSQHQSLFQWVSSLHQVAKVLELQPQHQSFQWIFRIDFLQDGLVWSPFSPRDSQESSPTPQFKSIHSLVFSLLYSPILTSIPD